MNEPYERLVQSLKSLPGLGYRSAEKIALYLLVEKPERTEDLIERISSAKKKLGPCRICGNLTDQDECNICTSEDREVERICVVETVTDLFAMEKAGVFRGKYHILMGKLSPVRGVGPEQLNINSLKQRLENNDVEEVILALSNDMEGEATCHFLKNEVLKKTGLQVTRIGFGLPSGGGITYADENTLLNALQSRKRLDS
ncbi:recombination mediator RecR [Opitutales bacterium]|nr:recombination mediator RecR [Opitutales bacterium]